MFPSSVTQISQTKNSSAQFENFLQPHTFQLFRTTTEAPPTSDLIASIYLLAGLIKSS